MSLLESHVVYLKLIQNIKNKGLLDCLCLINSKSSTHHPLAMNGWFAVYQTEPLYQRFHQSTWWSEPIKRSEPTAGATEEPDIFYRGGQCQTKRRGGTEMDDLVLLLCVKLMQPKQSFFFFSFSGITSMNKCTIGACVRYLSC